MSLKSSFPTDLRRPSKVLWFAIIIALSVIILSLVGTGVAAIYHQQQVNAENERIKSVVQKEEAKDEVFKPTKVSDADLYVGTFSHVQDVVVTTQGFSPSTITVNSDTKIVLTSGDGGTYSIIGSPDTLSPKYFVTGTKISAHSLLQLKVVDPGTYGFAVEGLAVSPLVVTVK